MFVIHCFSLDSYILASYVKILPLDIDILTFNIGPRLARKCLPNMSTCMNQEIILVINTYKIPNFKELFTIKAFK